MSRPFSLSVKVVILDEDDRCLIIKRSAASKTNAGKWEFPGGKMDDGETFDVALLREVIEETGLTIRLEGVAGCSESEIPDRKIAYIIMEGKRLSGNETVTLSSEHDDYRWVKRDQLHLVDLAEQFVKFAREYGLKKE